MAPGTCLGLTGHDGFGTSTLPRAILGELVPDPGSVRIDGRLASAWREARGRGGIAHVDGDPVILDGTIMENLSLFGDAGTVERVRRVVRSIGRDADVHRLPPG